MQIISRIHDYYDHGMGLGYSADDIRFIRDQRFLSRAEASPWKELRGFPTAFARTTNVLSYVDRYGRFIFEPFSIGFCGKIYHGIQLVERSRVSNWYDSNELFDYLVEHHKRYFNRVRFDKPLWNGTCPRLFLDSQAVEVPSFKARCIDRSVSIISRVSAGPKEQRWLINPILKHFEFYRIMPPFTAYQELSMWIGGVLVKPDNPMVVVSDSVKIHKRGFDKWSFRRQPKDQHA